MLLVAILQVEKKVCWDGGAHEPACTADGLEDTGMIQVCQGHEGRQISHMSRIRKMPVET
jgi:hypothetical protein